MHQVVLERISNNMDALEQTGHYVDIDTKDTTAISSYVIKLLIEAYIL